MRFREYERIEASSKSKKATSWRTEYCPGALHFHLGVLYLAHLRHNGFVFRKFVLLSRQEALEQMLVWTCLRSSGSFSSSSFMVFCLSSADVGVDGPSHLAPLEPEESSFFSVGFSGTYLFFFAHIHF